MILPSDVQAYKRTPTFTEQTVPEALLNEHFTKAGTWGLLVVEHGKLQYVVTEPGFKKEHFVESGATAVITPEHKHYVKLLNDDAAFHIVFYR